MKTKKILFILALLCTMVQGAWADSSLTTDGSGNYTIGNETDWATFCSDVNNGTENYSGKYVQLIANISVSEMVGTSSHMFQGTFLGDGVHTLTFTKGTSGSAFNEEYCAPFRYTNGATIKNLKVAGDIYTERKFGAGLIARPNGTTTITNCQVSTVIHSSVNGDGTHGGYLAYPQGNVNFSGCAYTGRMFTTNGTKNCGGFVGWHNSKTYSFTNSLYAPNLSITPAANEVVITSESATFVRGTSINSGCYYTETLGTAQGTQVSTSTPAVDIYKQITAADGNNYYMTTTVGTAQTYYLYTGDNISVNVPTIMTSDGTVLTNGTDFTVSTSPATVQEKGNYTLTITGAGNCSGTKNIPFSVADGTTVSSETTTMTDGVYAVTENVTITSRITISGNVTLALGEGKTLTATKGIELSGSNSLTIEGPGALTISGCDNNKSGIGAGNVGTLIINGGTIKARGGNCAAGIGGDRNNTVGGTITINGGVINAKGGKYAAGIGGGQNYWADGVCGVCGDVIINGGQVTAIAGDEEIAGNGRGQAIGVGGVWSSKSTYYRGTLTLNWTSPYDFVYCSSFDGVSNNCSLESITIADGKQFIIAGTQTVIDNTTGNLAAAIAGKKICGYNYNSPIALTDNDTYGRYADLPVPSATYTKTTDRVGKFHSWLVPFDHTITAADAEKFTFYKINMIANSPDPSQEASNTIWVYVKKLSEGDVLHASMPYVYKPKEAVTDYVFTADNNLLKPMKTGVIAKTETMEDIYNFYATYAPTTATAQDPFYYVNIDGGISLGNDGTVSVGAFRWIIRVESKFGGSTAYARKMTFFDGEETTSLSEELRVKSEEFATASEWYTLDGRKLDGKPAAKGIYMNGGKKVVIK